MILVPNTNSQSLFGSAGSCASDTLSQARMESKIVLNISLIGDLNMRNFEALLFNKIRLSDQTEDHEKTNADWSQTIF